MKKRSLLKTMLLLCALIAGSSSVWAADKLYYTLDGSTGYSATGSSAYDTGTDTTQDGITWNVTGNTTLSPWGIGGKNLDGTDRLVYSKTAMGAAISKVELEVGAASSVTVNSLTLVVASDNAFSSIIDEVSVDFAASSTLTFKPTSPLTEWTTGAYYKFVFNLTIGGSNKKVEFKSAKFYKKTSDPGVALSTTSLDFERVVAGETKDLTFTVTPENLTSDLSISCDNAYYTVSPASIDKATTTATTITVTAAPTAVGDEMIGTITISGGGLAADETVDLTCSVKDPNEISYDFSAIDGFSSWTSSYTAHSVVYADATVSFSSACKQGSTITDIPVQKAADVVVALNNKGVIMKSVFFTCRQWTTKTQTLRLYASTDGGKTWGDQIGTDQTDFDIESASLPANTNAVKLTSTTSNQVGIESVSFVIDGEHFNVHITDAGWASISYGKEIDIPAGITAYYAQKKDESTITLKEITGGYIPENTGVVVSGSAGTYSANVTATGATLGATNLLQPWLTAGEPSVATYYTLAVDEGNNPVFKQSTGGILAAGKAYLVMPAGAPSLGVEFESTNISTTNFTNDTKNSEFFNLAGQRVTNPTKGLYIVNGKKVVIK